jgi:hypothetical protein
MTPEVSSVVLQKARIKPKLDPPLRQRMPILCHFALSEFTWNNIGAYLVSGFRFSTVEKV